MVARVRTLVLVCLLLWQGDAVLCQPGGEDRTAPIEAMIEAGDLGQAVEACNAWITAEPRATTPHLLLADVYMRLELWDQAQAALEAALQINPALAIGYARLGDLLARRGEHREAREQYQRAVNIDGACGPAHAGLIRAALAMRRPDEAHARAQTALQVAPDDPAVLLAAGDLARSEGRFAEAAELYEKALEGDPRCPDALWSLAALLQEQGEEAEADTYWDRFLEVEPDSERAWLVAHGLVVLSERELPSTPGLDQKPVFSPDGGRIAFAAQSEPGNERSFELWVMPADGSAPAVQVTAGGGSLMPRWTLDGRRLLFEFLYEATGSNRWIFSTSADGTEEPTCLFEDLRTARSPIPIPGADRFLYNDARGLFTMTLDGADRRAAPLQLEGRPEIDHLSVSPDGKQVAFMARDWTQEGGPGSIYVAPLDGSAPPRKIILEDPAGRFGSRFPDWGPDGRRLLFSDDRDWAKRALDTFVVVLDDPRPPVKLFHGSRATWSPDGTRITFDKWTPRDRGQIFVTDLGGKRLPIVEPD